MTPFVPPKRAHRPLPGGMLLERTLRERGMRDAMAAAVARLARPALRYRSELSREALALGVSRTGGQPDLPPAIPWPVEKSEPLAFVAQIDLEQAARCGAVIGELPRHGHLAVFGDCLRTASWYPADHDGWRVYYFDDPQFSLRRRAIAEDVPENARFPVRILTPYATMTLPDESESVVEALTLRAHELAAYRSIHHDTGLGGDFVVDQLGGWPAPIQNGPFVDPVERESALVLQVGSDVFAYPDGSFAALYVSARPDDIAARRFDRALCLFESA